MREAVQRPLETKQLIAGRLRMHGFWSTVGALSLVCLGRVAFEKPKLIPLDVVASQTGEVRAMLPPPGHGWTWGPYGPGRTETQSEEARVRDTWALPNADVPMTLQIHGFTLSRRRSGRKDIKYERALLV